VIKKDETNSKEPYRYDNDFNSTLTIGGVNTGFFDGNVTYYSTADSAGWNLTTSNMKIDGTTSLNADAAVTI